MANFAEEIRKIYPDSRLQMAVTQSGVQSYRINVLVVNPQSEILHKHEYFGSGDLHTLKQDAIKSLLDTLVTT